MAYVTYHKKDDGGTGLVDVEAFTLDASGCDKFRHVGQAPLLVDGRVTWATEGKDAGQFSEPVAPLGYDPKTGAPIFDQKQLPPVGYDPKTGAPIYAPVAASA